MSLEHSLRLIIAPDTAGADGILRRGLLSAGVRPVDIGTTAQSLGGDPRGTTVWAWVIADDPDALVAGVRVALEDLGVEVLDISVSTKLVEPQRVNAEGVTYDLATGTLTVETWAPEWGDLDLALLSGPDSSRA